MLSVTEATKQAYYNHSKKHIVISFPNRNITLTENHITNKSLKLTESIETGKELLFKGCNASIFKFKTEDLMVDLRGEYVEASIQAGNTETIPLFHGYVADQTNQTHEDLQAELTCYDKIWAKRNVDVKSWLLGLTYPITVKDFRDSFFTLMEITQVVDPNRDGGTTLVNDSLTLKKPATTENVVNAIDIMQGICQINGRYGQIGRDNNFHYRYLKEIIKGTYPSPTTYPSEGWTDPETGEYYPPLYPSGENADVIVNLAHYNTLTYEPYEVIKIDKINILNDKGAIAGTYGSGDNALTVSDNIVAEMLNDPSTAAENLYGEVALINYVPLKEKALGLPFAECGDIILTRTRKHIVRSHILKRELSGEQSLFDVLLSTGNQYRDKYKESDETGITANRTNNKENADNIVRCNQLIADEVSARIGQFNSISADLASFKTVTAQNIAAVDAKFNNLDADNITAGHVGVNHIDVSSFSSVNMTTKAMTLINTLHCKFGGSSTWGLSYIDVSDPNQLIGTRVAYFYSE